ncbi:MAG: hypothetical protein R2727_11555 [Bacteroidales bacterium]
MAVPDRLPGPLPVRSTGSHIRPMEITFPKPSAEDIFETVYEMVREAKPARELPPILIKIGLNLMVAGLVITFFLFLGN